MSLMSEHKQIEKRNVKERLSQCQLVLCAVLKKAGPVVLTADDFNGFTGVESKAVEGGIEWRAV
jgi:hypothetical protein